MKVVFAALTVLVLCPCQIFAARTSADDLASLSTEQKQSELAAKSSGVELTCYCQECQGEEAQACTSMTPSGSHDGKESYEMYRSEIGYMGYAADLFMKTCKTTCANAGF